MGRNYENQNNANQYGTQERIEIKIKSEFRLLCLIKIKYV